MTAAVIVILLGVWVIYSGWRFYRQVNWNEPAVSTPDFGAMRKREAEILHIQEFIAEAHSQGKVSASMMEEFNRFCDGELAELRKMTATKR